MPSRRQSNEDLVIEIGQRLRQFVVGVLVTNLRVADELGLNPTDLGCLCLLLLHGPGPTGRLAQQTGLTTGAITGIVDRLEAEGFITRGADPGDRRRVIVTPNLEVVESKLMPHLIQRQAAATPEFYEQYSDKELRFINEFLARIAFTDGAVNEAE